VREESRVRIAREVAREFRRRRCRQLSTRDQERERLVADEGVGAVEAPRLEQAVGRGVVQGFGGLRSCGQGSRNGATDCSAAAVAQVDRGARDP